MNARKTNFLQKSVSKKKIMKQKNKKYIPY